MNQFFGHPTEFWLAVFLLVILVGEAFWRWQEAWAKPAVLVYGTVAAWYVGDLLYTGQKEFDILFTRNILQEALLQISLFLVAYRVFVQWPLPALLPRLPDTAETPEFSQTALRQLFTFTLLLWLVLFLVGLWIADGQILAILWPPSNPAKIGMFSRPAIGGSTAFLLSTAGYIYELVCALFAVFFVLAKPPIRFLALFMVVISWPYFWFDRIRNVMLALLLPALFCYWLFNRSAWKIKLAVSIVLFMFVNLWFLGVMHYRAGDESAGVIMDFKQNSEEKHDGLNMLEELCWMDQFIGSGEYQPNFQEGYLAQAANVLPRAFWENKPMIGVHYAMLRGQGGNNDSATGVYASIATGLIGQGVGNFGRFFGVLAAAFLMALWTGLLARLWRQRFQTQRLLLFLVGCGLTFNMGREITLLVLWPFVFGYAGVIIFEKYFFLPMPFHRPSGLISTAATRTTGTKRLGSRRKTFWRGQNSVRGQKSNPDNAPPIAPTQPLP
jgi:hypothetical protein